MDRERLEQVHQTDLTESRVNEDFVEWLKTKGLSWLLAILLGLPYLFIVRWRAKAAVQHAEAWAALSEASLPLSKKDIADQYSGVFSIPEMANLQAAEMLMDSIAKNESVGGVDEDPLAAPITQPSLTSEERESYLDRATQYYQSIIDADTAAGDKDKLRYTLFAVSAMNGMGAVAEARGDAEGAAKWFAQAAERAAQYYPGLAARSTKRADSVAAVQHTRELPTRVELDNRVAIGTETRTPISMNPGLQELIFPADEETEADGDGG